MVQEIDVKAVIENAEAAIREVEASMRSVSEDFYRDTGLDPEKLREQMESVATEESRAQARAQFEADLQAVEDEVNEEMARRSFSNPATRGPVLAKFPLV